MGRKVIIGIVLAVFVAGIILSAGSSVDARNNIEKMKETKQVTNVGDYTSEILKYTKGGVEIDNYATRRIYYKGNLIETIENKRALPAQVRPRNIVPAPGTDARLVLIDIKNPFWTFDATVKRDITCWVVHTDDGETVLYDAVTGKKVGQGIPAPTDKAIALSGFHEYSWPDPWVGFRENGAYWYNKWGFSTWNVFAPPYGSHSAYIQDNTCTFRYALAHGASTYFQTQKNQYIYATDIASWMTNRDKMTFAYLGHCGGMCDTGSGTLSYAFRKGSTTDTVTIGFCDMEHDADCWEKAYSWQGKLFTKVDTGVTWKEGYDYALACYPECVGTIRFVGDESLTLSGGNSGEPVLTIQSEPSGQKVYVDATDKGNSPVTVTVTCAAHTIKVGGNGGGGDLPDLIITDTWIGAGVSFKEKNQGTATAGAHLTHVSGRGTVAIPSLAPGEEQTFNIGGPPPYTWTVTADWQNVVEESNENNNVLSYPPAPASRGGRITMSSARNNRMVISPSTRNDRMAIPPSGDMQISIQSEPSGQKAYVDSVYKGNTPVTVTMTCAAHTIKVGEGAAPPKPDLTITDVWTVGNKVHYKVKNIGSTNAGASHTSLTIDGALKTTIYEAVLNAGSERSAEFSSYSWTCSGSSDTIKVRADANGEIDEANENNNYMEKTVNCGGGTLPDLTITQTWRDGSKTYFKEKNIGSAAAGSHWVSVVMSGQQTKYAWVDGVAPGEEKTLYVLYPGPAPYPAPWTVCADSQGDITESNEDNNCLDGN